MKKRNCALVSIEKADGTRAVWARGQVIARHCPKSIITSDSLRLLEMFKFWKAGGSGPLWDMSAKCADALLALDKEWKKEMENGKF